LLVRDIGGVLLTNGWIITPAEERRPLQARLGEMEERHRMTF